MLTLIFMYFPDIQLKCSPGIVIFLSVTTNLFNSIRDIPTQNKINYTLSVNNTPSAKNTIC